MKKPSLSELISAKFASLKTCDRRSRDRIRRELKALKVASQIRYQRRKGSAAA